MHHNHAAYRLLTLGKQEYSCVVVAFPGSGERNVLSYQLKTCARPVYVTAARRHLCAVRQHDTAFNVEDAHDHTLRRLSNDRGFVSHVGTRARCASHKRSAQPHNYRIRVRATS